ncbi:MAG: bile acid:sodium symporter [Desulfuromonadales bacterium]|jgi:bile acid:Na+ symporter, BASS family
MPAFLEITVPLLNFLIMFSVGTSLVAADFKRVAIVPRNVVLPCIAQILCVPLIGFVVVSVLSLDPYVVGGVLLIAACPGGSMSNFYSYLAKVNVALSVTLTGITCLAAMITMPLVMSCFEQFMNAPETFHVPIKTLLLTLGIFLLLPILLGMLVRHLKPAFVARYDNWLRVLSMVFLAALIVQVIWQTPDAFTQDLADTLKASGTMAVLSLLAGLQVGRFLKLSACDAWPVAFEMMVQNVGLAATIAITVFQQTRFASFAAGYFITQVPIAVVLILICLNRKKVPAVDHL